MPDQADALAGLEDRVAGLTFTLPLAPTGDGPAIACALGGAERSERADRRRSALAGATTRTAIENGVQLSFDPAAAPVGELAELAAAESSC